MSFQTFRYHHVLLTTLSSYTLAMSSCGIQKLSTTPVSTVSQNLVREDMEAEHYRRPAYIELATGVRSAEAKQTRNPWPFKLESIGHTSASYQNYGSDPYFHHGLDIRGEAGTPVLASRGGKVVNIENYLPGPAYWEVAILDDDGFIWQYHHVDHDSIPKNVTDAFASGGRIEAGAKLGEIFYWSVVTFGERYHHVHLNILGAGKKFQNPFLFLEPLADHAAPQILDVGLLQNNQRVSGNRVSGSYGIFAKIHDLILHDKFVVPANKVTISIDQAPASTVWDFNNGLPGGASETDFVENYFVPKLTCGDYECRELYVNLGFTVQGNRDMPSTAGAHSIHITASDVFGNETSSEYKWNVQ
jgi:Peptidase family M23